MQHLEDGMPDSRRFENYVARLYRHLGYVVQQDVLLEGQQVDVLVECVVPGFRRTRMVIECKYLSSGTVSNQEVLDLLTVVNSLRETDNNVVAGVLVTNREFSRFAKQAAAKKSGISLVTAQQLEDQLFDVESSFSAFKEYYERQHIFTQYISLSASDGTTMLEHVDQALLRWIKSDTVGFALVLGDFGTGKTTLLERLKYLLVRDYLEGRSSVVPFLLQLKDFHKTGTLDSLLSISLQREFHHDVPLDVFWNCAKNGKFVILMDGFDEMSAQVDADRRFNNMVVLSRLLTSSSKAILTCRPTYFISDKEYSDSLAAFRTQVAPLQLISASPHDVRRIKAGRYRSDTIAAFDTQQARLSKIRGHLFARLVGNSEATDVDVGHASIITLQALTDSHVDKYLQGREDDFRGIGATPKEVKDYLKSLYDLSNLMKRPILLVMIVETVLHGDLDIHDRSTTVGPAALYDIYTNMQFEVEFMKGETRRMLTKEQRLMFAQAIAVTMLLEDRLQVTYDEVVRAVSSSPVMQDLRVKLGAVSVDEVAADVHTSTFLQREGDGRFRFAHRSFMEFFVAREIKACSESGRAPGWLNEHAISPEVAYFLGDLAHSNPPLKDWLSATLEGSADASLSVVRRNALSGLLAIPGEVTAIQCRDSDVIGIKMRGLDARRVSLEMIRFHEVEMDNVTAIAWNIRNATLTDALWADSVIINSHLGLVVADSILRGCSFKDCVLDFDCRDLLLHKCEVDGGSWKLAGNVRVKECVLRSSVIVEASGATVEGSELKGAELRAVRETKLIGITVDSSSVVRGIVCITGSRIYGEAEIAGQVTGCIFDPGAVLSADNVTISKSSIVGATLKCRGRSSVIGCDLVHGAQIMFDGTSVAKSSIGETFQSNPIACSGQFLLRDSNKQCEVIALRASIQNTRFVRTRLEIKTGTVLRDCDVHVSDVVIKGDIEKGAEIDKCNFKYSTIRGDALWRQVQCQVRESKFANCVFLGVFVSEDVAARDFSACSGFVFFKSKSSAGSGRLERIVRLVDPEQALFFVEVDERNDDGRWREITSRIAEMEEPLGTQVSKQLAEFLNGVCEYRE